jgi:peptidoglycan-associated lipoprotein
MIKSVFVAAALAVVLAGCGSSVKLDDVPVEDKSGSVVTQPPVAANPGAGSGGTTQTRVEPVNLTPGSDATAGPHGCGAHRVL